MKLSVKKFSKKSLSLLIALIMVFSALPLTPPISAEAATTTIASNITDVYCVSNHAASRNTGRFNMSGNGVNICNDGGSDNFNSGYFKIDISSLPEYIDTLSGAKLVVNIPNVNKGALGVDFYATTTILSASKNSYMSSTGDLARESAMNVYSNKIYLGSYVHIGNTTTAPGSVTINSDISEVVKYMRSSGLTSFGIVAMPIGVGSGSTNNNGNWSDVWVHDISLGTITYTAKTVNNDIDSLKNAITAYETKMASGNIYTNTKDAYDAYVTANKAYDSYYYGNNTSISILTAAQNLVKATNKMMTWTAYSPKTFGSFKADNRDNFTSYNPTNYYKNLVYSQVGTGQGTESSASGGAYQLYLRVHAGNTVAIYDGVNEVNIPFLFSGKTTRNSGWNAQSMNVWGVYPTSARTSMKNSKWSGYDTSSNYTNLLQLNSVKIPATSSSIAKTTSMDRDSYYFASNVLKYDTTTNPFSSGVYYMNITPSFEMKGGNDSVNSASKTTTVTLSSDQVSNYSKVYLINYKAIIDALNNNKSYLANVSKYKEGGIATKMTSFQSATAMNPSYYSYATDIASAVSTCAGDIQTIVEYISGGTADNTNNYPKLRSAMDYSGTLPNFVSEGNSTQFTVRGAYNNGTNPGTFSKETYSAFKTAYENAQSTMSTVYSSGYKKGSEAAANATALLNAFNALELSNYRVNFSTIDDFIGASITKTVTVAKGGTVNSSDFPTITATSYSSNNKHNRYYWQNMTNQTEFTSQTVVNSDLDVVETKVEEACTIVNTGIEGDNVNLECSVCKNKSTLNASAYNAAVLAAQASINNEQAYTETSRNELNKVLSEQDKEIYKAKTQQEVDNCTSTIVYANQLKTVNNPAGTLVYNQYSITVNYVDEKGAGLGTQEITNVNYGTIKEVTAETNFGNKSYVVYKWTRSTKDGDKLSGLNSTSVSVNVVRDLTYYVHLKSTQSESPNNTAVVTLNNKAGKPVDVGYVTTNEAQNVVVNGNSIKIGTDTTLTAPQYSFYSVKGFIVNNELITAQSGTKSITVTKDMTIVPLYSPTSYVNITRKSGDTFTINGKNIDSYSAKWDELITLETTDEVIWYTTKNNKEVVLGQGAIFKFRANENIEIYTKQVGDSLTPNSRVGYFGYDADLKKVTIVNNFFVPGGANESVKAGVVVSTKAKTRDEMIAQYNAGSLKFEGGYDKFTADKNQIRITINRNGSGDFSMWALSYVIVDGTTYFADDVISYTYNSPSKTA